MNASFQWIAILPSPAHFSSSPCATPITTPTLATLTLPPQILVGSLSLAVRATARGFVRLRVFGEKGAAPEKQTLVCAIESSAPGTAIVDAFEKDESYIPVCKKVSE